MDCFEYDCFDCIHSQFMYWNKPQGDLIRMWDLQEVAKLDY